MIDTWNETLFEYYKEAGGSFTGDIKGPFPECRLTLEYKDKMIHLEPVIKSVGNKTIHMRGRAILSCEMEAPLTVTLHPYDLMRKAVELVVKKDITTGNPALDKLYLIRGSNPDFIKMILNGSRLAELLVSRRDLIISVKPVIENETLHMVQVLTKDYLNEPITGEPRDLNPGYFADLAELCYETWRAVTDYRWMQPN